MKVSIPVKGIVLGVAGVFAVIAAFSSFYTTPEGHVSIIKRFDKAINTAQPGLHFKIPFIDGIENMEVRTRKYSLQLSASTTGVSEDGKIELQMPSQIKISANWNIPREAALQIYREYGGLDQYESRILDPRVTRAAKQVFAKYTIEKVVSEREIVRNAIESALIDALSGKLATMSDINIEDVTWSPKIKKAVEQKQTAKLSFEEEQYKLDKQNLEAQQGVNSAIAEAESIERMSIATAAKIEREGEAVAKSLLAKSKVLANNPHLVDLIKAERWDGILPRISGGAGGNMGLLLQVDPSK